MKTQADGAGAVAASAAPPPNPCEGDHSLSISAFCLSLGNFLSKRNNGKYEGVSVLTCECSMRGAGAEKKSINPELWQACAGPLVNLPPAGTHVVYFPQGHSEQVCLI